jgi:2,4-dienoyl-CoA reductase-like NADH-dependent reductase (Old Yellow Enzyme family)
MIIFLEIYCMQLKGGRENMPHQSYKNLFQAGSIGNRPLANRFVSQAMEGNDGQPGGSPSDRTIERYKKLAEGHWGVVIVEALTVDPSSKARVNQMILSRENLEGFKLLVREFKAIAPETLLLFQVTHSGRKAVKRHSFPTALYDPQEGERLLKDEDIEGIRKGFVDSSLLAEEAGADGVDFKMCHGYLGCEMLRPGNLREDQWGGSFENRTRFLRESVPEIRSRLKNKDFIIGSRISVYEGIRGGCGTAGPDEIIEDLTEAEKILNVMKELEMDYVNISAGIPGTTSEITRPTTPSRYLYLHQMRYAKWAKERSGNMKVIGSAYSILKEKALDLADENIRKGFADCVGWGRQSFADPLFPAKVEKEEAVDYCIACSGCSKMMIAQVNDGCMIYNKYYKELWKKTKS